MILTNQVIKLLSQFPLSSLMRHLAGLFVQRCGRLSRNLERNRTKKSKKMWDLAEKIDRKWAARKLC
jgi:hypothetical protein